MSVEVTQLLKQKGLRNTPVRAKVLELLTSSAAAVSHADLEKDLADQFDRVTLYRTLNTLEEKHLIHKILSDQGTANYALDHCVLEGHDHHHQHAPHIHFHCEQCGEIQCLNCSDDLVIQMPEGFKASSIEISAKGVCDKCG